MILIKTVPSSTDKKINLPYAYRFCHLHISEKYKQILFIPYGKMDNGMHCEIDKVKVDDWPCNFENLQINIEEALNQFAEHANYVEGKWPSFEHSKAKSKTSFETDYIQIRLETDLSRNYGEWEVERINVSARPTILDNYSLNGWARLIDTKVAQIVLDIYEACIKIRS